MTQIGMPCPALGLCFSDADAPQVSCSLTFLGKFKRCGIEGLGRALQKSIGKNQLFRKKGCHVNGLWMILRKFGTCPTNLWDNLPDRAKRHYSLIFTGV